MAAQELFIYSYTYYKWPRGGSECTHVAHQRAALPSTDIISLVAHQLHEGIVPKPKEVAEKCNSNYITFYKYIFGYMLSFEKKKKKKKKKKNTR